MSTAYTYRQRRKDAALYGEAWPPRMSEWTGRRVVFREDAETRGGVRFQKGEEAEVTRTYKSYAYLRTRDGRTIRMHVAGLKLLPALRRA